MLAQQLPREAVRDRLLPLWEALVGDVSAWAKAAARQQAGPLLTIIHPEDCPDGGCSMACCSWPSLPPSWPAHGWLRSCTPCVSLARQSPAAHALRHLPPKPPSPIPSVCSAAGLLPASGLWACDPDGSERALPAMCAGQPGSGALAAAQVRPWVINGAEVVALPGCMQAGQPALPAAASPAMRSASQISSPFSVCWTCGP